MCRDDRGQALVMLVAVLGFAALVVASLAATDHRLLLELRALRAAEGAAEAAGAAVADALVEIRADDRAAHRERDAIDVALADPALETRARVAAGAVTDALGARLGAIELGRRIDELSVRVSVGLGERGGTARVGVRAP